MRCVATGVLLAQLLLYCSTVSVSVADPGSGCGIPEVPLHARVRHGVLPFYRTGQSLEYVCRAGYEMRGVERVVCVQDDTGVHWSHGPPTCIGKVPEMKYINVPNQSLYYVIYSCGRVCPAWGTAEWSGGDETRN